MHCLPSPVGAAPVTFICFVHLSGSAHALKPEISGLSEFKAKFAADCHRPVMCLVSVLGAAPWTAP